MPRKRYRLPPCPKIQVIFRHAYEYPNGRYISGLVFGGVYRGLGIIGSGMDPLVVLLVWECTTAMAGTVCGVILYLHTALSPNREPFGLHYSMYKRSVYFVFWDRVIRGMPVTSRGASAPFFRPAGASCINSGRHSILSPRWTRKPCIPPRFTHHVCLVSDYYICPPVTVALPLVSALVLSLHATRASDHNEF